MIHGLISTMLIGMLGGLFAELIRIVPALRMGRPPGGWEIVASLIMVVLGGGACLFGWDSPQPILKVAVMGAAFPLLFSAAVGAAKGESNGGGDVAAVGRSLGDYLTGRF